MPNHGCPQHASYHQTPPQRRMDYQEYKTVSLGEDPEDARSSTEVDHDESRINDGDGWTVHLNRSGRKSSSRRRVSTIQILRGILDMAYRLAILVLLVLLLRREGATPPIQLQVGSDHTGRGPHLTTTVIKWNASPAFVPNSTVDFFSPSTLATWNSLLPSNAARPIPTDTNTFSTTSMTHQLHCLFMMGRIYAGVTHAMTDRLPADYHAHFLHCIDYLRQGVMCAGDLAVEPHGEEDADDLGPLDGGWAGMHVCKEYGGVLGVLEGEISEGRRVVLGID
ncbi:hypothetical protein B0T18DRAFT_422581, partial [Schizothecium vesticola]